MQFAARSGLSGGGAPRKHCGDRVSADAAGRMRGMARLPAERSRPDPAPMRACAGHPVPMHGPTRPGRFIQPSNPASAPPRSRGLVDHSLDPWKTAVCPEYHEYHSPNDRVRSLSARLEAGRAFPVVSPMCCCRFNLGIAHERSASSACDRTDLGRLPDGHRRQAAISRP